MHVFSDTPLHSSDTLLLWLDDFMEVQSQFHEGSKLLHEPSNSCYRSVLSIS